MTGAVDSSVADAAVACLDTHPLVPLNHIHWLMGHTAGSSLDAHQKRLPQTDARTGVDADDVREDSR